MKNTFPYHFLNQISYLFLVIAVISSCGEPKGNHFVIEGNIAGVRDSAKMALFKTMDPLSTYGKMIAADTLIDGCFSFDVALEDSLDEYSIMLFSDDGNEFPHQVAKIYAEPGKKAVVSGKGVLPMKWKVRSKVGKQKDQQKYLKYIADISSEIGLASKDLLDSLNKECFVKTLEYLESEKTSEIWMGEFRKWAKYAGIYKNEEMKEKLKALLPRLSDEQMKNPLMLDALPYLDVTIPLIVGDAFPELNLYDADGLPHKVSDFSGKKVLLGFSEVGCAACRRSQPEIEELCRTHPDDFVTLIVNQNGYEAWRKEARAPAVPNKFEFNDENGSSGIFKRLGTRGYPTFVLISPEGIITDIWVGYAEGSLLGRI